MSVQMMLDLFPRAPTHSPRSSLTVNTSLAGIAGSQSSSTASSPMNVFSPNSSVSTPTKSASVKPVRRLSNFLSARGLGSMSGNNSAGSSSPTLVGSTISETSGSVPVLVDEPGDRIATTGSSHALDAASSSPSTVQKKATLGGSRLSRVVTTASDSDTNINSASNVDPSGAPQPLGARTSASMQSVGSINDIADPDRLSFKVPSGLPDRDYVDLMKRACKGVIAPKDQELLYKLLVALSPSRMAGLQRAVHELMCDKNSTQSARKMSITSLSDMFAKNSMVFVYVSKYNLDFGMKGRRMRLNKEVSEIVSIEMKSGKPAKFTLKPPEKRSTFYILKIEPTTGKLKPGKEDFKFSLQLKRPMILNEVIVLEIEGGFRHFFTINMSSEWSNFGAALSDYQMVEDAVIQGHPRMVPEPLSKLRMMFMQRDGLDTEEIFRKQVDDEQIMISRVQFDQKQRLEEMTPETITNLIKVWFRELPERLFDVTVDQVLACQTLEQMQNLFKSASEPAQQVALWLFDLMSGVVAHKDTNRMNSKKLSIIMAPNLFPSLGSTNAVYLRKQADIFLQLLDNHVATVLPIFDLGSSMALDDSE